MRQVYLSSKYEPGSCINLEGRVVQIVEKLRELDYLPGGGGVAAFHVRDVETPTSKYPLTRRELRELAATLAPRLYGIGYGDLNSPIGGE
jgi:hypothetical protein